MTPQQRETALRLAEELTGRMKHWTPLEAAALLRELAAKLQEEPAPGYCKHCKQYTIEEPLPAEPLTDEQIMGLLPNAVRLPSGWRDFARAIEAAHGIGENVKPGANH